VIQKLVSNFVALSRYASKAKTTEVAALAKYCNHRSFILAVKHQLKSIAEGIEIDYMQLSEKIGSRELVETSNESKKHILIHLIPSLVVFKDGFEDVRKCEKTIIETASELESLRKPSKMRKMYRIFSKKDKKRIKELSSDWLRYSNAWSRLRKSVDTSAKILTEHLNVYLDKLFVYSLTEHLARQSLIEGNSIRGVSSKLRRAASAI